MTMASRTKKTTKPVEQRQWPADKVERRPIGELLAYPQNPMLHTEKQIQQIADSIREFGWTMPALVKSNVGSSCGTSGAESMRLWPRASK